MSGIFGGGGSQPAGNVTNITNQAATTPLSPFIQDIGTRSQNIANRGFYGGPFITPQSPFTLQAQQLTANRALAGSPLTDAARTNLTDTLQGKYLDPNTNPFLANAVNDALGLAKSNYLGLYGGPAGANVNNSGFQEGLTRDLGNVATRAYSNAYQQGRQNQLQAAQLAPGAAAQDYANLGALTSIGQQQEARGQAELGAAQQQFYAPNTPVQNYAKTLGLLPPAGSTSTSSATSPYFTNPAANALGLGLGAASLYNMGNQSGLWSSIGNIFGGNNAANFIGNDLSAGMFGAGALGGTLASGGLIGDLAGFGVLGI